MRIVVWLALIAILGTTVLAETGDITLALNQTDYYFPVGQNAIIPLESKNSYNTTVSGILGFTLEQTINRQGFQFSSSNSRSATYDVPAGLSDAQLNLGTSNDPLDLGVTLQFDYDLGGPRTVQLGQIQVHFGNVSQGARSITSASSMSGQIRSDPFQQRLQQMQQQMQQHQTFGQDQQGGQLPQDSAALKQEIANKTAARQQMEQELAKKVATDPQFQQKDSSMRQQGYNPTSNSFDPTSSSTGSFTQNYQNPQGQGASVSGTMQDGKVDSIASSLDDAAAMQRLNNDPQYKALTQQLLQQGFNQSSAQLDRQGNRTDATVTFNNGNQTATIGAQIKKNIVSNVRRLDGQKSPLWWVAFVAATMIIVSLVFLRKPHGHEKAIEQKIVVMPIDHHKEALRMLDEARSLYATDRRNAFGKAGQGLRLFLSYEYGTGKELTNDEVLRVLKNKGIIHTDIGDSLTTCSMVQFAKHEPDEKEFMRILSLAHSIIMQGSSRTASPTRRKVKA